MKFILNTKIVYPDDGNEIRSAVYIIDLQIEIYPELEKKFLTILRNAGFPSLEFGQKIDFEKLYKDRLN